MSVASSGDSSSGEETAGELAAAFTPSRLLQRTPPQGVVPAAVEAMEEDASPEAKRVRKTKRKRPLKTPPAQSAEGALALAVGGPSTRVAEGAPAPVAVGLSVREERVAAVPAAPASVEVDAVPLAGSAPTLVPAPICSGSRIAHREAAADVLRILMEDDRLSKVRKEQLRRGVEKMVEAFSEASHMAEACSAKLEGIGGVVAGVREEVRGVALMVPGRAAAAVCEAPRESYAQMTKRVVERAAERTVSAVVIRPQEVVEGASSEKTKVALKAILNPVEDGFRRVSVRRARGAAVVVETTTAEGAARLIASTKLKSGGFLAEKPKGRLPRVVVYDTPSGMSDADLLGAIYEANDVKDVMDIATFRSETRRVAKFGPKGKPLVGSILACTGRVRQSLLSQGAVFLGWSYCNVRDYVGATRCYRCHLYGHVQKDCRYRAQVCGRCAAEGHEAKKCASGVQVCASCKRFGRRSDHPTGDRSCPALQHAVERVALTTSYDG
jgi:hypothetical protein